MSININGANPIVTDSLGRYNVTITAGKDYTISPTKNNDKTVANGVSGTDISLIQSHILKKVSLNSPYKLIAADVNNDGAVIGTDIALIKSLILKHITQFNGNKLWSFVDSSYIFPVPTKPFPYYDGINISAINTNRLGATFIGVKLGDVNYDWNAAVLGANMNSSPIEIFNSQLITSGSNNEIRIPIKVKNFKNIMGMQYTLAFNSDVLELKSVESNKLNVDYNLDFAKEGKIPFLWVDASNEARTLTDSISIFELVFNKKGNISDEDISLSSDITSVNAFDGNYASVGIIKGNTNRIMDAENTLKLYPNPVRNLVTINFSHITTVNIIDNMGKVVKQVQLKDATNPTISVSSLLKGAYHLQIRTISGKEKLIGFIKE